MTYCIYAYCVFFVFLFITPTQLVSSGSIENCSDTSYHGATGNASTVAQMQRALLEDGDTNWNVSVITSRNLITCEEDGISVNASQITPDVVREPDDSNAARLEMVLLNLYTYGSPVLIVVGTVGNTLAAVTLQSRLFARRHLPGSSWPCWHSAKSRFSSFHFWEFIFEVVYSVLIRSFSSFGCKLHCFLTYVMSGPGTDPELPHSTFVYKLLNACILMTCLIK